MTPSIIDLSHNNAPIDMHDLRDNHGIVGAIIKCDELSFKDPACRDLVARSRSVGWLVGLYCFLHSGDGAQEAVNFLADASGLGQCVIAVDYEESANQQATPAALENFCQECVGKVGRHPLIYSDLMFARSGLTSDSVAAQCPGWLADISGHQPKMPPFSRGELVLWQYTFKFLGTDLDASQWMSSTPIEEWWEAHTANL